MEIKSTSQRVFFADGQKRVICANEKFRFWNEYKRHVDVEGDKESTRFFGHGRAVRQVDFNQGRASVGGMRDTYRIS